MSAATNMVRIILYMAALSAAILPPKTTLANEPESMLAFYSTTPASLLDVFIEATNRNLNGMSVTNFRCYYEMVSRQESLGEKYRATLPQKDLDLYCLSSRFYVKPGGRFTVKCDASVSPYHSIMQKGLDDEAACRNLLSEMLAKASVETEASFFEANDGLHTVQLFTARKLGFLGEIRERTRTEVEWMILTSNHANISNAPKAERILAAKGIAARLYFAKCQEVPHLGEAPKEIVVESHDFPSIQKLFEWRAEFVSRNAENEIQELQQELKQKTRLLTD